VAVLCAGSAAGGWLLGYPELIAVCAACLAAIIVAGLWSLGGRALAVTRAVAPPKVQRGGDAVGTVRVVNAGRRATRALTAVDRVGSDAVRVEIPPLARRSAGTVGYLLPTYRRGELPVGPLLLRADDPFGLLRRVLIYGDDATVLVRPRTAALTVPSSGRRASLEGPTSENAPSGTATFHTLREYVPGDDLRHVHWRTTARTNTLMVRHLVDSALPETVVVLDTRGHSYPAGAAGEDEDFDIAVDAAATVAAGMASAGFPVTIHTSAGDRFHARAARAVSPLLDRLALLTLDRRSGGAADLGRALERARHTVGVGGALALVTGPRGEFPGRSLTTARGHFERTVLMCADARGDQRTGRQEAIASAAGLPVLTIARAEDAAAIWQRAVRR
jgi:uncharacterized protein (DUF58 family)